MVQANVGANRYEGGKDPSSGDGMGDGIDSSSSSSSSRNNGRLKEGLSLAEAAQLLGWWPVVISDVARVMLLTSILFAGPLFEEGFVRKGFSHWGRWASVKEVLGNWIGFRNFVAVSSILV